MNFCISLENVKNSDFTFLAYLHTHTHTHTPFNGPFSGTTRVSQYQKGNTNLDFCEARDSEWQWHPLGHIQVCTSLQTDNHASTTPLSFLQAGCRPTNSVKALKEKFYKKVPRIKQRKIGCAVLAQGVRKILGHKMKKIQNHVRVIFFSLNFGL